MRNVGLIAAAIISALLFYAVSGDIGASLSVLIIGGCAYVVSLKPSIGGPLLYAFIGFFAGFILAILLGVTVFKNSTAGGDALISLLIIGPVVAVLIGRRHNYRLWVSLRP